MYIIYSTILSIHTQLHFSRPGFGSPRNDWSSNTLTQRREVLQSLHPQRLSDGLSVVPDAVLREETERMARVSVHTKREV